MEITRDILEKTLKENEKTRKESEKIATTVEHLLGKDSEILNTSKTYAENIPAGTVINIEVTLPTPRQKDSLYLIQIFNTSTVTDLTCVVLNAWKDVTDTIRYSELTRYGVSKNTLKSALVQGWSMGTLANTLLRITNDTALGVGQGFTFYVNIRQP